MEPVDRGLLHGDVDGLTAFEAGAIEHRGEGAERGEERPAVVRQIAREPARRPVRKARREEGPRGRERRQRFEPPARARPREPEVRDHHVDEVWMARSDRRRLEADRRRARAREVVEDDVGVGEKRCQPRRNRRVVAVER